MFSDEYEHVQVQFRRLLGATEALESLVGLLLATHPDRERIVERFKLEGDTVDGIALFDGDFTDAELADMTEARHRVLQGALAAWKSPKSDR